MEDKRMLLLGMEQLGLSVPESVVDKLLQFSQELQRWNRRVNLTSIKDPSEVIEKHLIDSLSVLPFVRPGTRLLDIGSGGGFPVVPLNIALPDLDCVSVDAVQKKIAFQRHAGRTLGLERFEPLHCRIEDLAGRDGYRGSFDLVVSRALSDLPTFLEWAVPFLAEGGQILAMKGREGEEELASAAPAMKALGLVCVEKRAVRLPFSGSCRYLLLFARADDVPNI